MFLKQLTVLIAVITIISLALSMHTSHQIYATLFEVDVTCNVYKVVDGDTFDCFPVGRIRLADIDAPESNEPGYYEARNALANLVINKNVYLDVDDIYVMDRYNRVVAVVYIRYNVTHLLNVNKWLVNNGYADVSDYYNEFNPYTWRLYEYYPEWMENQQTTTVTTARTITTTVTSPYTVTMTTTSLTTITTTTTVAVTQTRTTTTTIPSTTTVTQTITSPTTITTILPTTATITVARTFTETSPITVYQRVTEWSTAIALSIVLLVIGVVIGRFMMKRG